MKQKAWFFRKKLKKDINNHRPKGAENQKRKYLAADLHRFNRV